MKAVIKGKTVQIELNQTERRKINDARGLLAIIEGNSSVAAKDFDGSVVEHIDALLAECNGQTTDKEPER